MFDAQEWKLQDKFYHENHDIVESFDRRIIRKYELERKYFTLYKWIEIFKGIKAQKVLDFGCATGTVSLALARNGIKAFALDASSAMIDQVKKKAQAESLAVTYIIGDAEQLPIESNCFDGVICLGVLHHLPNITKGLEEQIRVLKTGGMIFISEPFKHRAWISYPYHFCIEAIRRVIKLFKSDNLSTRERLLTYAHINEMRAVLDQHHLDYQIKYFVYWPNVVGFLPEFIGYPLVCSLNKINQGSNRGDIVIISITKNTNKDTTLDKISS